MRDDLNEPLPRQTATSTNPYGVPHLAWSLIEEHFVRKYKLKVSEVNPTTRVEEPTITWRIVSRVPGSGREGVANSRGPSHEQVVKRDQRGMLKTRTTQRHRVTYEWAVYATSSKEVDEIAWDLEQALIQIRSRLQEEIEGFNWTFERQTGDTSLAWKAQDDLMVRTLRFEAEVPISYEETIPELRKVVTTVSVGSQTKTDMRFRRLTRASRFDIPIESGVKLLEIVKVSRLDGRTVKPLERGVDYQVRKDERGVPHIEWLDEFGAAPEVGQDFLVDYALATNLPSHDTHR